MDRPKLILTSDNDIRTLLEETRRIAILGIKPESRAAQPAFYVSKYVQDSGYEIVPVPVYYPDVTEILGKHVFRDLRLIPGDLDMVIVFRRTQDIGRHVDEIIEKSPRSVWFQLGITNDPAAEAFASAGIKVVQNLCIMVEHRALIR
ncbi:MAG: CoA-binding protein [Blastocatellia bacterium]|nr:CoA-binding protein [Chloracidobacterium sp.]MBL8185483.1 CoA-binding protein [Blastocatellia bacterium]HRJ88087.1 CoA-binding protein [Pyrinomonadaceae bacterium]HRK51783.1 CoA-binding protein [Pyrinomonadaceae bacterium]